VCRTDAILSGDAVKDYPNLATSPRSPGSSYLQNAIYGVRCVPAVFVGALGAQNLLDAEACRPNNAAEYKSLVALHPTTQNWPAWVSRTTSAWGLPTGGSQVFSGSQHLGYRRQKTGKLTALVETEQFRAAVSYARDLWTAGIFHPNAMQYNLVSAGTTSQQAIRVPL